MARWIDETIATVAYDGLSLKNGEYLYGEDTSDGLQELIGIDGSDIIQLGDSDLEANINSYLQGVPLKNNNYLVGRNSGDSADRNLIGLTSSDKVDIGNSNNNVDFSSYIDTVKLSNANYLQARNSADSADRTLIGLNGSDAVILGNTNNDMTINSDIDQLVMTNTNAVQALDSGNTARDLIGVNASDEMEVGDADITDVKVLSPMTTWNESPWTFEYVSTTSIKVSGSDVTEWFTRGTKIRLQNNDSGTYLHFWVTENSTADATPDTTINVTGEDDVPNATLTDGGFSYADTPKGMKNPRDCFKASAYLSSSQDNIAQNTSVQVELDTENYDTNSDFDTSNHRYVAPISACYLVSWGVEFDSSDMSDQNAYLTLGYVNGSRFVDAVGSASGGGTRLTQEVTRVAYVEKGQYIELYAKVGQSGQDLVADNENTFMDVQYVGL